MGGIRIVYVIPFDSALENVDDSGIKFDPDDVPDLEGMPYSEVSKKLGSMPCPTDTDIQGALDKFGAIVKMGVIQDGRPIPSMFTWVELAALSVQGCTYLNGKGRLIAIVDSDTYSGSDDSQTISDTHDGSDDSHSISDIWQPADADYTQYLYHVDDPIDLGDYELYSERDNGKIEINRAEMYRYIRDLRVVYDKHGHAYQWDLVRYRPVDNGHVRRLIRDAVPIGSLTDRMISEVISELKDKDIFEKMSIPDDWNRYGDYDGTILPFKNGWLNIDTGKWLMPSPFYTRLVKGPGGDDEYKGMTYCFNVAYNPNVAPSAGSAWFRRLIPDDDTWRFVMEFYASVMRMGGGSPPGFLIFYSEMGETGKSAMYESLAKILGPDLVSRFDLDGLNGRFIGSMIEDKWVLICGEIGSHDIGNDKRLKQIANREEISVEKKGVDGYDAVPDVGMIFASNTIPNFGDQSAGMRRRVFPVPMDQKMDWDDQIWIAMHSDASLSWLVNEIIRAHKARGGGKYTVSAEMQALRNVFFSSTDSFYAYLCDLCETDTLTSEIVQHYLVDRPDPSKPDTFDTLYADYRYYCDAHYISKPLYDTKVSSRLRGFGIKTDRRTERNEWSGKKTTVSYLVRM